MFDLGEVGVGIAVVDQRVQKFGCFPDGLLALLQAEVFLLFAEHVVDRLVLVVEPVELGDAGGGGRVVLPELLLGFAFFVAAFKELVPLFKIVQGGIGLRGR